MAKKQNKSEKVRKLLVKGLSVSEIAEKLGVSKQLIYVVAKNNSLKPKSVKRGRKPWKTSEKKVLDKLWFILSKYREAA